MAYLIPPMTDEPPPDYLRFAAARRTTLHHEAAALVGGNADVGDAIAMEVLTDIAGHWRRLTWRTRLTGHDAAAAFLRTRLTKRTAHWRDEQLYPVEVVRPPAPALFTRRPSASVALRLAPLTPTTVRDPTTATAEAEIAWLHAYRRSMWWRYARVCGGFLLILFYLIHFMEQASGT
ncbi:hypothetical protein [Symbioplanes lichenis]|uniref:hypothetical protein n=1 Tax=Symbioplanes lichenis TaxID=1629072 RepID=UPI0027386374|nr:hypothetical protein [Actinoplanes lichenis]